MQFLRFKALWHHFCTIRQVTSNQLLLVELGLLGVGAEFTDVGPADWINTTHLPLTTFSLALSFIASLGHSISATPRIHQVGLGIHKKLNNTFPLNLTAESQP